MGDAAYAGETGEAVQSASAERPVSSDHVRLVRETYLIIEPASDLVATLFFRRLDEIAPEARPFLGSDVDDQRKQLLISLGLAVAALDRFDDIAPALKLLGSKYRAMGVTEFHYGAVGEALMWTLEQSLGAHWSPEAQDAWTEMCTVVAEVMTATD